MVDLVVWIDNYLPLFDYNKDTLFEEATFGYVAGDLARDGM